MNRTGKVNPLLKETFVFRPLQGQPGTLRYADGAWIPDDGQPDLAFVAYTDCPMCLYVNMPYQTNLLWKWDENIGGKLTWHYQTIDNESWQGDYWEARDAHPNEVAGRSGMGKCLDLYGCANGRGIDLIRDNEYIKAGELLIQSTRLPVKAQDNPVCYLCLNDGRGHYIAKLEAKKGRLEGEKEDCADGIKEYARKLSDAEKSLKYTTKELDELNALMVAEGIQEEKCSRTS